jgi:hypothetical protein
MGGKKKKVWLLQRFLGNKKHKRPIKQPRPRKKKKHKQCF